MPTLKPGAALPRRKPYDDMTLDDVRALVREVRERGLQIQSHYKHIEKLYEEWEDDMVKVEKLVDQLREDSGLTKEEIYEPPIVEKKKKVNSVFEDLGIDI